MVNRMKFAFHIVSEYEKKHYVNGDFIVWIAQESSFNRHRIIPCYSYTPKEFAHELFEFMLEYPNGVIETTDRLGNIILIENEINYPKNFPDEIVNF